MNKKRRLVAEALSRGEVAISARAGMTNPLVILLCFFAAILFGCPSKSPPEGGNGATKPAQREMSDAEALAINNRGLGLMGQFDYDDAALAFEEVVGARPELVDVRINLMIATFNRQLDGDEAKAIEMARDVLKANPDHARAHYCLGLLLYRAGELEQATKHYEQALALHPKDAYALYSVAQCLEQQGSLEEALAKYEQAIALDPLLRSSYLRASQVNRRMGREEKANELLEEFERLATNPQARLIESKYTRMGPLAEAVAIMTDAQPPEALPDGPVFAAGEGIGGSGNQGIAWAVVDADARAGVTACDVNGDGAIDLFFPQAHAGGSAVLLGNAAGGFDLARDHALANLPGVNAALWGDIDNDGRIDAYICRNGANQLWMQAEDGSWHDRTSVFGAAGGVANTVDGGLIDADHDGDLDILLINADQPNELLNNNRDGTFRAIGEETGIAGDGRSSVSWVAADFDTQRDLDLFIIKEEPPNEVYLNDRGWAYRANDERFAGLIAANIDAAVAADVDADGQVEMYGLTHDGSVGAWEPDERGVWVEVRRTDPPSDFGPVPPMISVIDVDGDGVLDAAHSTPFGWRVIRLGERFGEVMFDASEPVATRLVGFAPVAIHDGSGYAMVGVRSGAPPMIWQPGSGRHQFVSIVLSGGDDPGQSMRSNFSGIGTRLSARIADQWTVVHTIRPTSGPGQSLQPTMIGLAGHEKIDFVQLDWPDGLFQTELALGPGETQRIAEKQRQVSSCPVLFAWDGSTFAFVTDLLGVGGVGYMVAPGEYAPPRPWERVLLPAGLLQPRDGRYAIKLSEPMEEACYLDAVHLVAIDLPEGWSVTVDDRMGISDPQPTGELLYYRDESVMLPARAFNDRGEEVRNLLREADRKAAPVGEHDARFIGRLAQENIITLEFAHPIAGTSGQPVLVIDGWVEYPYSQTMFAAWQAGATYKAPTLEARTTNGEWQVVYEQFGYPAGMPRQMALPIDPLRLPVGATALRLRTNQEVYWDRIAVVQAEACGDARMTVLKPMRSELIVSGYAKRSDGPQRLPMYDYEERSPFFDMKVQAGQYTHVGRVDELVVEADGAVAIFGPGEEVHVEFEAPSDTGRRRVFVLDAFGWCKDMDLYTKDGETLAPLPAADDVSPERESLHARYNTRYQSGN